MTKTQQLKRDIRAFMPNYDDERLAWLLAHARSGKLSYSSCCCFIGVATASHALRGSVFTWVGLAEDGHLSKARRLDGAATAEIAYALLHGGETDPDQRDARRRRILIPMIRAEMKRRAAVSRLQARDLIHA